MLSSKILTPQLIISRDAYAGGTGGARIAIHTELFPSLLSAEETFSGIADWLVPETFSGGKPPDPQIIIVLLGDQCIKYCSSGKEFTDQNLAL